MINSRLIGSGVVLLSLFVACAAPGATGGTQRPVGSPSAAEPSRAATGETVYLVDHYVRPDGRAQFEEFVDSILFPALRRTATSNSSRERVLLGIRLLRPVSLSSDTTYTYTFMLDPVVVGERYNVLDILREVYAEEDALNQYSRFTITWARDFTSRPLVQAN
jgi:hypothetical protein